MALPVDLRAFLLGRSALTAVIGTRCYHNRAEESYDGAYCVFARATIDRAEDTLDEAVGSEPFRSIFDLECISLDGEEVDAMAAAIDAISNYRGAFGNSSTVQAIFVTDHSDDYVPRGLMSDEGLEFVAYRLEIVGYTPA